MKTHAILGSIAIVLVVLLATPYFMVLGVVEGWASTIQELKIWRKLYWRNNDERAD